MTNDEIKETVDGYWLVSSDRKRKLNDYDDMWAAHSSFCARGTPSV